MKFSLAIFGLVWLTWFSASAQITVELLMDQSQFLPSESLLVKVRVTNRSGQLLHLGADPNWVTFSVTAVDDYVVTKYADAPVQGEFDLDSSQMATKAVDVAPYFKLTRQGGYRIVATLHIKDWNVDIPSPPQNFEVIDGAKLWSQSFGIPAAAGATNGAPEARKYTLEQANYLHSQLRMYVQVSDDAERQVFKVRAIGPMVSFSQPEAQLDRLNNLHVIYQSGARVFTYTVVNPAGDFVEQENYDYFTTRPRLQTDDQGNITVLGGVRRVKPTDMPMVMAPGLIPAPAPTPSPAKP
ncbi:MAG: hypothetical protein WAO02_09175 [Verrucomicrobiia bacterium]